MKETVADLCGRCAAIYADSYNVERVAGGRDHKVVCSHCGRKHYGGTYLITPKRK